MKEIALTSIPNLTAIVSTILNRIQLNSVPTVRSMEIWIKYQLQPLPICVISDTQTDRKMFRQCAKPAVTSYFQMSRQKIFQVRVSSGKNFFAITYMRLITLSMLLTHEGHNRCYCEYCLNEDAEPTDDVAVSAFLVIDLLDVWHLVHHYQICLFQNLN